MNTRISVRLIYSLAPHWQKFATLIGALVLTFVGLMVLPKPMAVLLVVVGVLLSFAGLLGEIFADRELSQIKGKMTEITLERKAGFTATEVLLRETGRQILQSLKMHDANSRITFYGIGEGCFHPIARYSQNPKYELVGRSAYSTSVGFIADVWERGVNVLSFPKAYESRIKAHEKTHLDKETVAQLTLLPTVMWGFRLDYDTKKIGLIVVEGDSTTDVGAYDRLSNFALEPSLEYVAKVMAEIRPVFKSFARVIHEV